MTSRPRKLDRPHRGPRKPSEDEVALWQFATQDIAPLQHNRARETVVPLKKPLPAPRLPNGYQTSERGPMPSRPAARFYPSASTIDPLTDRTPGLDRNTAKALRKGERSPEARVDLHGMTLERAHSALTRFILSEQARGTRCVLVITGKGGNYRARADGRYDMDAGGALKRDVPRWLREPVLAGCVVGIYQAHKKHGGDGALYVYLRKTR